MPLWRRRGPWDRRALVSRRTLIAALAGFAIVGIVVLAAVLRGPTMLRHGWPTLGAGAALASIVWLTLILTALRALSWRQKAIGGILLIASTSMFVDTMRAILRTSERNDIGTLGLVRMTTAGAPYLPSGATPGPITRRGMAFYRFASQQDLARRAAYRDLGFTRLNPIEARTEPALLTDCGRFARAKPVIDKIDRDAFDGLAAYRIDLAASVNDAEYRAKMLDWFDTAYGRAPAKRERRRQLVDHSLDLAGEVCALLAQGHWRIEARGWRFTSAADYATYTRLERGMDQDRREMESFTPPLRYKLGDSSPKRRA